MKRMHMMTLKMERKKERQTPKANEKMKMRVASGGI